MKWRTTEPIEISSLLHPHSVPQSEIHDTEAWIDDRPRLCRSIRYRCIEVLSANTTEFMSVGAEARTAGDATKGVLRRRRARQKRRVRKGQKAVQLPDLTCTVATDHRFDSEVWQMLIVSSSLQEVGLLVVWC